MMEVPIARDMCQSDQAEQKPPMAAPELGVVVVTYASSDVIAECLKSLLQTRDVCLHVVVVDNASPDHTLTTISEFLRQRDLNVDDPGFRTGKERSNSIEIIAQPVNLGFAGAVNVGLKRLDGIGSLSHFWILNPDCIVAPTAAGAFLDAARTKPHAGLIGGRTMFVGEPPLIQSDGGRINPWTGVCCNVNNGESPRTVTAPAADSLDFVSGANFVVSRNFVDRAGYVPEDYFLYYEEVDWAQRRGDLQITTCPDAIVHHHSGTSIGSGSRDREPSAFSNYFNYRNRMRYLWRHNPIALPTAYLFAGMQILRLGLRGSWPEAAGAFLGASCLPPPRSVRSRVSPESHKTAFGGKNS